LRNHYYHTRTLAGAYADTAATEVEGDQAANRTLTKYADFTAKCILQTVTVENLGPVGPSTLMF